MTDVPHTPAVLKPAAEHRTSAWSFQRRVLAALILRDMLSMGADRRLGYLWMFVQQGLVIVAFVIAFTVRGRSGTPLLPILVFVVTGYPLYFGFMNMWAVVANSCISGGPMLMFPQITLLDVVLSKVILEMATQTATGVMIGFGIVVIGGVDPPADPLAVMMAYWAALWLGVSIGFISGSIRRYFPHFEDLIRPVRRLGIFISGVVVLAAELPYFMQPYFFWNPVFKCIEIARESWYPAYRSPIFKPWDVVLCLLVMTALGLTMERMTRRSSSL